MLNKQQVKEIKNGFGVFVMKGGLTRPYEIKAQRQAEKVMRDQQKQHPVMNQPILVKHIQDRGVKRVLFGTYTTKSGQVKSRYVYLLTEFTGPRYIKHFK